MIAIEMIVEHELGIHARPAQRLAKESTRFQSDVFILKDDMQYNGKSIMSILSMGAMKGDRLVFHVAGRDEVEATEALKNLIAEKFGE